MGAFLDFKESTGGDLSKADMTSLTDNLTFMWCVLRSSCRRNKKEFLFSLTEFADMVDLETLAEFQTQFADSMGGYQKKMTEKRMTS